MQAHTRATRIGWTATLAAFAAAAQLACGTSDRQRGGAADRTPDQRDASAAGYAPEDMRVNLTGCLERGVIPGSFVLTHVSTAGNNAGRTGGTTGTSGSSSGNNGAATSAGNAGGDTYTVASGNGEDLGQYIGKRVTVAGRFAAPPNQSGSGVATSEATASPGQTAGPATAAGSPGSRASTPGTIGSGAAARDADSTAATAGPGVIPTRQITATAVRQVAASCTAGQADNPAPRRTP
jgi:hypothetical protein